MRFCNVREKSVNLKEILFDFTEAEERKSHLFYAHNSLKKNLPAFEKTGGLKLCY